MQALFWRKRKKSHAETQRRGGKRLNRRILRDETGTSGDLRHFYYNRQWQVLEERVGSSSTSENQYVYHPHYVDSIALRYDSTGTKHFYMQDALFNVTAIANSAGTVVERYAYSPYGVATVLYASYAPDSDNKSDFGNELLYTGRRIDPATGLQLNRNRFYHQQLGRWVSRDPIGYESSPWNTVSMPTGGKLIDRNDPNDDPMAPYYDGFNLYQYVRSRPTIYADPSGLKGRRVVRKPWSPHTYIEVTVDGVCYELHYSIVGYSVLTPCTENVIEEEDLSYKSEEDDEKLLKFWLKDHWGTIYVPLLHDCNMVTGYRKGYPGGFIYIGDSSCCEVYGP